MINNLLILTIHQWTIGSPLTTHHGPPGRLSEDEIERMLKEAEENAESDKKERQKVEAKNQLEGYLYSLRNTLDDEGRCDLIVFLVFLCLF